MNLTKLSDAEIHELIRQAKLARRAPSTSANMIVFWDSMIEQLKAEDLRRFNALYGAR
jgi:hypothetical protein